MYAWKSLSLPLPSHPFLFSPHFSSSKVSSLFLHLSLPDYICIFHLLLLPTVNLTTSPSFPSLKEWGAECWHWALSKYVVYGTGRWQRKPRKTAWLWVWQPSLSFWWNQMKTVFSVLLFPPSYPSSFFPCSHHSSSTSGALNLQTNFVFLLVLVSHWTVCKGATVFRFRKLFLVWK